MTDCEQCPMWGPDEHGSHTCLTRYCIMDPLAAMKEEADDLCDYLQAEQDAADQEAYEDAMEAEYLAEEESA